MGRFKAKPARNVKKFRRFRFRRRPRALVFVLIILMALFFQAAWIMEKNIHPMLLMVAKTEVRRMAQDAMLKGVQEVQDSLGEELNHTISVEKGPDGRIMFVRINTNVQTKIYKDLTLLVHQELKSLKNAKIGMTLGQIMQSNMFANYGPKIPLQMVPKGATRVSITPKLESKGINMTMVTLNVSIENEMGMVVPFSKENVMISYQYPIAQALVVGEVPQYYFYNDQEAVKKSQPVQPPLPVPSVQPTG